MSSIADNIRSVTRRIQKATEASGRAADSVQLLAVSKTRPPEAIREAAAAGHKAFGENYLQEALDKIEALRDLPQLQWHFIGPIQSNKTRAIAENFDWVHSVDRLKIAQRLSEQRRPESADLDICIQVNIDNEASKAGCRLQDLPQLASSISELPRLRLRGLMAIPDPEPAGKPPGASFRRLAEALAQLRAQLPVSTATPLDTLSMGMSADLEAAVAEGATWVRVGTDLFGARS